jgi:Lipase (class 3)
MVRWFKSSSVPPLSNAQLRMYASESSENFRWVSKLVAKRSPRTLFPSDLASTDLQHELSEIGQFAEVAHGHLSPFIWRNMDKLCQPDFPLDGYYALRGSNLVSAFCGTVAELEGYVAVRLGGEPTRKQQVIIVFSGTAATAQALHNLDLRLVKYPGGNGRCAVHAGFWKMFGGVRSLALEAMSKAFREYDAVEEIVFTGHSLGAVMCYLLALHIMMNQAADNPSSSESFLPTSLPLKLAVFGSPRLGNRALSLHWQNTVTRYGEASVNEYSVKAFNDGQISFHFFL